MEPVPAFALLLGMFAVTSTSDTIASVMLGIPGTAASQATILDGYPLAQKGQAARALGAAFTVSAFGGVFGALILAVSIPIILPVILSFNSPELFMLGLLGLAMVGSLSGGSVIKGLAVAALGILLASVGEAVTISMPRFTFGTDYLSDNLPLIPVVMGLFAIPEIMELAIRNTSISKIPEGQSEGGKLMDGVKDAFRHWWLATRCAVIGTYVGMLPGLGASIVDWIAYGHAVQSAKDKSQFGKGDIRGVIAPEAANNATRGGSLVPTVAFGIPGSLGTAILLGALLIQGLKPGPEMLTDNLHITFSMVWSIVVANIVVAILLMFLSRQVAKVAFLPGHLLVPGVILFVFMGAWIGGASLGDWITCLVMGMVGFIMKRGGWPRPPLILALILGSIMENAFQISINAHAGFSWAWERPIVVTIWFLIAITVFSAVRGIITNKATTKRDDASKSGEVMSEGSERSPLISLPFAMILFAVFYFACWEALRAHDVGAEYEPEAWPVAVSQFPLVGIIPGILFVFLIIIQDGRDFLGALRKHNGLAAAWAHASEAAAWSRATIFFGYLIAMVLVTLVIGQKVGVTAFYRGLLNALGRISLANRA
jgi:putative tricarboxylic transport membrane protein